MALEPIRDFDDFFRVEFPRLLRLLSAADHSAADALQEAFAEAAAAWERISTYDDPAGWVRRVAVHRMLNERRSARRKDAAVARLHVVEASAPRDHDATLDLAAAIEKLTVQQRVALTLFYLGDLSSAETGEAMGITDGAVRFHLHAARRQLREMLGVSDD